MKDDKKFMLAALSLAKKAQSGGDIPVGAVVVKDGEIIGEGYNRRESQKLVSGHAEIAALDAAAKKLGDWRLNGCTIYVTLEPCPMCAAAIYQSRVSRLVYGSKDDYCGAAGGKINMFVYDFVQNPPSVTPFAEERECNKIISDFFKINRKINK